MIASSAGELEVDAGVEAERRFLVERRVAEDALLVVDEERRVQLVEARPAHGAGDRHAHLRAVRHVPAQVRARVELEVVLRRLDLVAVDDDADGRQLVGRLGERLGHGRVDVEAREFAAGAEFERDRAPVHGPLHEAVGALVLGVEQREARVVLLEHALVHLERVEGEVAAAVVALDAELEPRVRQLEVDGRLEDDLASSASVNSRPSRNPASRRSSALCGTAANSSKISWSDWSRKSSRAVGVGDARRVEVEVEVVLPVGLDRRRTRSCRTTARSPTRGRRRIPPRSR